MNYSVQRITKMENSFWKRIESDLSVDLPKFLKNAFK